MLEMPDAWPTWSADTDDVDADEAGPLERPRPTASRTSGPTKAVYVQLSVTNARTTNAIVVSRKPSATARSEPMRTAIGVMNGVTAIIVAAAGSVARPATSAVMPKPAGFWK